MAAFVVLGCVGLVIVVASLVFGELFEGLFDAIDVDTGSGLFSAPVIGAFLAALGFGAALTMSGTGAGAGLAALVGAVAGVAFGAAALLMTRSLMHMSTDDNVRTGDLVGRPGTVVTRIPAEGLGEISLVHLGQRLKMNARASSAIPAGTPVVVTDVVSSSSVHVEPEARFWASDNQEGPQ